MRRWIGWIIFLCLLAGGATTCAIRWEAWFGNPPEPEWVGDTINHQFLTFANDSVWQSKQIDTLEFLLLGDIHNSLSNEDMSVLSQRHTDIDFLVQLGDWLERPYLYYEQMLYQSMVGTALDSLPIIAIPGNHEYLKGLVKVLPEEWKKIFPNPHNGPKRFLGSSYFVDFPYVRIIAIDTDGLQRLSDYTQVLFWLNNAVHQSADKFTIVLMHHPIFSTAKGRQNPLMWLTFYSAMRDADLVFSGHDHNYARRTVKYKKRWWTQEAPTVFVTTNASNKNYLIKDNNKFESAFSGKPVYEYIQVTSQKISIYTYQLESGELVDECLISR